MVERFQMPEVGASLPVLALQAPIPFSPAWHREQLGQVEPPPSAVDLAALVRCLRNELVALRVAQTDPARAQAGVAPKRARDAKPIPVATEPGDLVDAKWVAQRCRVSPSTANKWLREISGRTVGTRRVLRVTLGEFERFWERRQRKGCRHGKSQ